MSEFDQEVEPFTTSGYAVSLLVLGLGLGLLTVRHAATKQEQSLEVTKDFKTFQATFMSEQDLEVLVRSIIRNYRASTVIAPPGAPTSAPASCFLPGRDKAEHSVSRNVVETDSDKGRRMLHIGMPSRCHDNALKVGPIFVSRRLL